MIGVFVSDQDAVDLFDVAFDGGQARQCFSLAESGVHEEAGALRLEQRDVARAAGRQNGDPQADRVAPSNQQSQAPGPIRGQLSLSAAQNKFSESWQSVNVPSTGSSFSSRNHPGCNLYSGSFTGVTALAGPCRRQRLS